MKQAFAKNKYFDFKISDTNEIINNFKNYVNDNDCPEIVIDLSSLNMIDAARVMVLSSSYHFGKYPFGKVKCKVSTKEIRDIVSSFLPDNLELV